MIVLTSMDKLPHSCMSCPFQKNQKTPFCRAKRNWYRPLENVPASFGFYIKEWDFSEGETPWNARARWCPLVEMPDRKDEPTISKMEQVDELQTEELPPYLIRDWEGYLDDFEVEDEPQTEREGE